MSGYQNNEELVRQFDSLKFSPSVPRTDIDLFDLNVDQFSKKTLYRQSRFGRVYKAQWHGPIVIKEIEIDVKDRDDIDLLFTYESIRETLFDLKMARHSNLILFIGASFEQSSCLIAMSNLCDWSTLYDVLYSRNTTTTHEYDIDWRIDIGLQIAQGMGYLHNRNLINKDLRSKNVFVDGHRAVISDYCLFDIVLNAKKDSDRNKLLPVHRQMLNYMAPELIRALGSRSNEYFSKCFNKQTDVFAFGTIWFELLYSCYPFAELETYTLIYKQGSGMKALPYNSFDAVPNELSAIFFKCWQFDASKRPDFHHLIEQLRIRPRFNPKLTRYISQPI